MTTLSFEINYGFWNAASWTVNCWLTVNTERHLLSATKVFPPFGDLLSFVQAIAAQRLPSEFTWEEEGPSAEFAATPVAEDSSLVHLKIVHSKSDLPWIEADLPRQEVVQAFLPPLVAFAKKSPFVENWGLPSRKIKDIHI